MPTQNRHRTTILFLGATLLVATLIAPLTALAGPLFAFGDHRGEDHSNDDHRNENLESINLSNATLQSTDFRNTTLRNAILTSADLVNADLRGTDLSNANLRGADLTGTNARGTDFSNATLDGAVFTAGDVRNTNFTGASLLGADLSVLSNADRADFTGARYNAFTLLAPGIDTSTMTLVPEPSSAALLLLGLIGLEVIGRPARPRTA
jgi:uncharacterized protein YjbI with pentapeptide repeats